MSRAASARTERYLQACQRTKVDKRTKMHAPGWCTGCWQRLCKKSGQNRERKCSPHDIMQLCIRERRPAGGCVFRNERRDV